MRPWSSLRPVVLWTSKIYLSVLLSVLANSFPISHPIHAYQHQIILSSHCIASRRVAFHVASRRIRPS